MADRSPATRAIICAIRAAIDAEYARSPAPPSTDDFAAAVVRALADHQQAPIALAQPEPEVVGPSDESVEAAAQVIYGSMRFDRVDSTSDWVPNGNSFAQDEARRCARAVLARWGRPAPAPIGQEVAELVAWLNDHATSCEELGRSDWAKHCRASAYLLQRQATPAPAGDVGELVTWLREGGEDAAANGWDHQAQQFARVADLLERLASPACLVLDPSPETIAALKAAGPGRIELLPEDARVIEPTKHTILVPAPVPVAVSLRPWEREGWCDESGRCWFYSPRFQSWSLTVSPATTERLRAMVECLSLPFHALPLPNGEEDE